MQVVERDSAVLFLSGETVHETADNHFDMCKFTGADDVRYETVKFIVEDLLKAARRRAQINA